MLHLLIPQSYLPVLRPRIFGVLAYGACLEQQDAGSTQRFPQRFVFTCASFGSCSALENAQVDLHGAGIPGGNTLSGAQASSFIALRGFVCGANACAARVKQSSACFPGQPPSAPARAAALRPGCQADAVPVSGAARAHPAEHHHRLPSRLLRAADRGQRQREEAQPGQVRRAFSTAEFLRTWFLSAAKVKQNLKWCPGPNHKILALLTAMLTRRC